MVREMRPSFPWVQLTMALPPVLQLERRVQVKTWPEAWNTASPATESAERPWRELEVQAMFLST